MASIGWLRESGRLATGHEKMHPQASFLGQATQIILGYSKGQGVGFRVLARRFIGHNTRLLRMGCAGAMANGDDSASHME